MADPRKKLLCIEDDRETALLIAEALSDRGFDVAITYNGQEGLFAIVQDPPALVLCDIGMPVVSGFEVLERLNKMAPRLGHIPFVFLTALTDRDSELKGRRLGADDYVTKPIDFDVLVTIINARLAGVARTRLLPTLVDLSEREIELLTLVAHGKTSGEIARELRMSKRTVDYHLDNARMKLGAETRTEAAVKAASGGLIKP
jgi:DNA-binding NarL/FixJ family response regulator